MVLEGGAGKEVGSEGGVGVELEVSVGGGGGGS